MKTLQRLLRAVPYLFIVTATLTTASCATEPSNPSFPLTSSQAHTAIQQMQSDPKPLAHPILLIGGFLDPNIAPDLQRIFFHTVTCNAKLIPVSIGFCTSFAECRQKVIAAVDAACPSSDPIDTTEVDVVGVSLGGLVARYAAAPDPTHPRRLKIARLFSISGPQSGSKLAENLGFTDFHKQIRPNSSFLNSLATQDSSANYILVPYIILNDNIIDPRYAAPPGQTAFWLPEDSPLPPHFAAPIDERILADIARRLRGETPFSHFPAAPLPNLKPTSAANSIDHVAIKRIERG